MKMNCSVVDDLLPLYIDGGCSKESKLLLEEHLKECPACQEKLRRMQSDEIKTHKQSIETLSLVKYADKVRKHKLRVGITLAVSTVFIALLLSLTILAIIDMHRQASPAIHSVEEGVVSLAAEEFDVTSENVSQYIFYTNSTGIEVVIRSGGVQEGVVELRDAYNDEDYIQLFEVTESRQSCTFNGLSASRRYKIVCSGMQDVQLTVSQGKVGTSFWSSVNNVIVELFGL